jgi:hypothetical protein
MQTEPAKIITSADGTGSLRGLTWSAWGDATALGRGTLVVGNCQPNCAEGTDTSYPATVTLSDLTSYGDGEQAYAHMAISAPSAPYVTGPFNSNLVP